MTDRYTRAILTVIAISLSVIAFRGPAIRQASADSPMHVIVDQFLYQYGGTAIKVSCENCR